MLVGDLRDDRQPQAGAIDRGAQRAVEGLEDQLALGRRNARPRVLDLQHHRLRKRIGHHPHRDGTAARGVVQRVVDQIGDQLAQQQGVAEHIGLAGTLQGVRQLGVGALVAQIDAGIERTRHEVAHHIGGQGLQVDAVTGLDAGTCIGPRHRQQLVDHVRRALRGPRHLLQRGTQQLRIAVAGVDLARSQLGLHAQARQRRLELVRRIRQEALLRRQRGLLALEQVVDRLHQRRDLLGHLMHVDRRDIVAGALADALLQRGQRRQTAHQRHPHQQHRHRQDDELRQDHALDDLGGQPRALGLRLGHLHQHRARVRSRHDPLVGHTHAVAVDLVVAHLDLAGRARLVGGRQRQVAVAADDLAPRATHQVIDIVDLVGAQHARRLARQVEQDVVAAHLDALAQRAHRLDQRPVIRQAGDALRGQPGQRQAHRPQQQQRREHPVEDLAEQRALLAPARKQPDRRSRRRGRSRNRQGLRPRSSQDSSPDRARWRCGSGPARSSCAAGGCRPRWRCC